MLIRWYVAIESEFAPYLPMKLKMKKKTPTCFVHVSQLAYSFLGDCCFACDKQGISNYSFSKWVIDYLMLVVCQKVSSFFGAE